MTLERILERHDRGDYLLHHWIGIIRGCITARQACRRIQLRMEETAPIISEDSRARDGFQRMIVLTNALMADLWALPAAEFEELAKIKTEELLTRAPFDPTGLPIWVQGRNIPGV